MGVLGACTGVSAAPRPPQMTPFPVQSHWWSVSGLICQPQGRSRGSETAPPHTRFPFP